MRSRRILRVGVLVAGLCLGSAFGFLPPTDTAGPITVTMDEPGPVTTLGEAMRINVTVKNAGGTKVDGTVRLGVIDDWQIGDAAPKGFSVEGGGTQGLGFEVIPGKGSYAALYPVHAYAVFRTGTAEMTAHAILIVPVSPGAVAAARPGGKGPAELKTTMNAEPEGEREARRQKALEEARDALHDKGGAWSWKLVSEAGVTGVSIVPGPCGLADAFFAIAAEGREVVFDGFTVQVDGVNIGTKQGELRCKVVENRFDPGRGTLTVAVPYGTDSGNGSGDGAVPVAVQVAVRAEKGALVIGFSMPGVQRDPRGEPRFTALGVGAASEKAHRVYAGFGNVIQDPGRFDLEGGGFGLSTRHVGMDFANGISLVQASDLFPDRLHVDPERREYALMAHHDATFTFVPSTHGAFGAARVYRDVANFRPGGGVGILMGRMCLDQWGGDYRTAAKDIQAAVRYGLIDSVFVKHVWQCWGYDYRLPDIFPPAGNVNDFRTLVEGCRRRGILFCPHDNYIDFYPDARGFSYDDIAFHEDGTPMKAWYNKGRDAQAYRWSPNAFEPWLEANLKRIKPYFAPTAYFLDVFSAMPPFDFYDRAGRFYPKTVTTARWGYAFDQIRKMLGNNAPMISEAGDDALIGHQDGGEADHEPWLPAGTGGKRETPWRMQAGDGERIPWHDMASHGTFVLLGGGLGPRYAAGQDEVLHGYGSDDYLCTTVMGGRNPMCDGPFSRRTVMTYWLLHDVCDWLAHSEMLSDEFAGDDIHRQVSRFSNGGVVVVNRGKGDWTTEDGTVLPQYGFIAKAGNMEAEVTRREGIITGFAKSAGNAISLESLFVDARPANAAEGEGGVTGRVAGVEDLGGRRVRVRIDWTVSQPVAEGYRAYLHFVGKGGEKNEGILFQGSLDLDVARLAKTGTYSSMAEVTVPASIAEGREIAIRYGLYKAEGDGRRLPMQVATDEDGRALGGIMRLEGKAIDWRPEPADPTMAERAKRLNVGGKVIDFGPVATNGAFRMIYGRDNWEVMPLPGSGAFTVKLRLDQLHAGGRKVQAITGMGEGGNGAGSVVKYTQDGDGVEFETGAGVVAYRVTMGG